MTQTQFGLEGCFLAQCIFPALLLQMGAAIDPSDLDWTTPFFCRMDLEAGEQTSKNARAKFKYYSFLCEHPSKPTKLFSNAKGYNHMRSHIATAHKGALEIVRLFGDRA